MSNINSLRNALAAAQDIQGVEPEQAGWFLTYTLADRPRPSGIKSINDRAVSYRLQVDSDLHQQDGTSILQGSRSSEAGIRQREAQAQVQCSRRFNEDALQDAEGLVYEDQRQRPCEDAPCCGCCGPGSDDPAYNESDPYDAGDDYDRYDRDRDEDDEDDEQGEDGLGIHGGRRGRE